MPAAETTIFEESTLGKAWRPRRSLPASVGLHVVIFLVLLRGRSPVFIAPSSALGGAHGTSVTHLYWTTGSSDRPESASAASNSIASQSRNRSRARLILRKSDRSALAASAQPSEQENQKEQEMAAASAPAPTAGSSYGSLSDGAASGEDVRPALPAMTSEPRVSPDDLRGIGEGNVVVEITIDESGAIVQKSVMQSMGPALDARVLEALENWRFHPATRDGVPIPSKQDVVYHFKPRPS
ncbi:MAG: energy transducer TonB [Terriglobales bacterium]